MKVMIPYLGDGSSFFVAVATGGLVMSISAMGALYLAEVFSHDKARAPPARKFTKCQLFRVAPLRQTPSYSRLSGIRDFLCELDDPQDVDVDWILSQNTLTLYTLDPVAECLVILGTQQFRNLFVHPNLVEAQRRLAVTACVVPFAEVKEMAWQAKLILERKGSQLSTIVMLYSTGQCASTTLAHFFERIPGVVTLVEPDFLTQFAKILQTQRGEELFEELFMDVWTIFLAITVKSISVSRSQEVVHTIVIKPNTLVFQVAERLQQKCPHLKCIFMYNSPREFCEATVTSENSKRLLSLSLVPLVGRLIMSSKVHFYREHLALVRRNPVLWSQGMLRSCGYLSLAAVRWLACIETYLSLHRNPLFAGNLCAVKFRSLASHFQRMDMLKALANFVWTDPSMKEREFEEIVKKHSEEVRLDDLTKTAIRTSDILWNRIIDRILSRASIPVFPLQLPDTL